MRLEDEQEDHPGLTVILHKVLVNADMQDS